MKKNPDGENKSQTIYPEKKPYVRPTIRRQFMGYANKFGGLAAPESMPTIDGVNIKSLTDTYGSPLFIFSQTSLRKKVRELNRAFATRYPHFQIAWSYKTNYLDAVCQTFHEEGSWAEVVSSFEYQKARHNGIPGDQIIFNGPYKPYAALKEAAASHSRIHIDHLDELLDLIKIAGELGKTIPVALRLNMDTGTYPSWDRFGFNLESGQALEAVRRIASSGGKLKLRGLHTHVGTFMLDTAPYQKAIKKMADFWKMIVKEFDQPLEYLDIGGGFASASKLKGTYHNSATIIPSFDQYAETICTALLENFKADKLPMLFLETGRALVDEAGFLVSSIVANKTTADGRRAFVLDAGVNLLYTSTWYDFSISPVDYHHGTFEEITLFGPLCMNIDKVRDNCLLPNLQRGEKIVIHPVGAYNVTQWMQFIEMRPAIVMILENGKTKLIREAESLTDLLSKEHPKVSP
jgi:diaminopimelate decarboxylase